MASSLICTVQRQINFPVSQRYFQQRTGFWANPDPNVRGDFGQPLKQSRKNNGFAIILNSNHEFSAGVREVEGGLSSEPAIENIQRLSDRLGDHFGSRRGQHALRTAFEQRILQTLAQSSQCVAHGWLRKVQLLRSFGDASLIENGIEDEK